MPDAITALCFAIAWIAPTLLGPDWVRGLLVAIYVEFLVMHASALYGFGIARRESRMAKRYLILGAITALYLVPVSVIAVAIASIAPVLSFVWLYASRFVLILANPATAVQESRRMQVLWFVSLASFIGGIVLVSKLPLPALGLTPDFLAELSLSHRPDPSAQPVQISLAFGVLYFLSQSIAKALIAERAVRDIPP